MGCGESKCMCCDRGGRWVSEGGRCERDGWWTSDRDAGLNRYGRRVG